MSTVWYRHAHSDLQITKAFVYIIVCNHWHNVPDIEGKNTISNILLYDTLKIPTNKGANSYKFKLSELGS